MRGGLQNVFSNKTVLSSVSTYVFEIFADLDVYTNIDDFLNII